MLNTVVLIPEKMITTDLLQRNHVQEVPSCGKLYEMWCYGCIALQTCYCGEITFLFIPVFR